MPTTLPNILEAASGTPWAVEPRRGQHIANVVADMTSLETAARISENERRFAEAGVAREDEYLPLGAEARRGPRVGRRSSVQITEAGTAVMPIHGTIMKRPPNTMSGAGGTSSDRVRAAAKKLRQDPTVKKVVLDVNSSGGSVEGIHGAAEAIRDLAASKKTVAVANDRMYSAAYWLAAATGDIRVTPSSGVGSIGVLAMVSEKSELLEKAGVNTVVIRSVDGKARPSSVEPFREEDMEKIQSSVEHYHEDFVNSIAASRNISYEEASAMADGSTYDGEKAIEAGYADGKANLDDLIAAMDAETEAEQNLVARAKEQQSTIEGQSQKIQDLRSELEETKSELEAAQKQNREHMASKLEGAARRAAEKAHSEGRIKADKVDHYAEMGAENGVDFIEAVFDGIPKGAAFPVSEDMNETPENANASESDLSPGLRELYKNDPAAARAAGIDPETL